MGALSKLIAKELTEAFEGVTFKGRTPDLTIPKSKMNPLVQTREPGTESVDEKGFYQSTFYSPVVNTLEQMSIGKKGTKGENISAFLNKRAPNVAKAELDSFDLDLDPKRLYSREEALNIAREKGTDRYTVDTLYPPSTDVYRSIQRQQILDREVNYVVHQLQANKDLVSTGDASNMHYGGAKNLGHSRSSVRQNYFDPEDMYLLIEEAQSDLATFINKVAKRGVRANPKLAKENKDAFIKDSIVDFKNQLESLEDIDLDEDVLNTISKYYLKYYDDKYYLGNFSDITSDEAIKRSGFKVKAMDDLIKELKDKHGISTKEWASDTILNISTEALITSKKIRPYMDVDDVDEIILQNMGSINDSIRFHNNNYYKDMFREFETKSPVVSRSDYLKRLLLANISFAKSQGIDKIVIPNYKEIARTRASSISQAMQTEAGSEIAKKYEKAKQKGFEEERKFAIDYYERVFKKTYEDSLRKVINELNKESKGTIKVGTRDLLYTGEGAGGGGERTTAGTQLDISNFKFNPQKEELRFNEGGLVKKPGLMQRPS
jgi:hypothetical protein